MTRTAFVGQSVKRLEDPDLLRGRGQFLDDLRLPGLLEAAFVRSPFALSRFAEIDAAAAMDVPGVAAVYTALDLPEYMRGKRVLLQVPNPAIAYPVTQEALATEEVCFAGEAVAIVIAETRHAAEDGAERVIVAWDPLPAVADCEAALKPAAPVAHSAADDNVAGRFTLAYGRCRRRFSRCRSRQPRALHAASRNRAPNGMPWGRRGL